MSFIKDVTNFLTGGVGGKIIDAVSGLFPDSMSEEEKAAINAQILAASREHELKLMQLTNEAELNFNNRIKDMEGTAKDLKNIKVFGPLIIFLRGAFRPLFAYAIAFCDLMVFSGQWMIQDDQIKSAFWMANLIVLVFFFGERAVKNILPALQSFIQVKKGG